MEVDNGDEGLMTVRSVLSAAVEEACLRYEQVRVEGEVTAAEVERAAAEARFRAHYDPHLNILTMLSELQALSEYLRTVEGGGKLRVMHVDAKSSIPVPHQTRTGTGVAQQYSMNMNGITELATDQIATYSINSTTASNECTNTIANEMLLDVMLHGEGEDVLVFFFDCCGLNRNVSELILTRSL